MVDPIQLELFKNRFASVAEEMGMALRRTSYSPNIKERLDFSCAVFDAAGQMIAQAAHIPVHLGAMPISVKTAIDSLDIAPGDVIILNDPYHGGSHLPDITIITPVFVPAGQAEAQRSGEAGVILFSSPPRSPASKHLFGFVASRAHHADVGGMTPGSMPLSTELFQEGVIIPPLKLVEAGKLNEGLMGLLLANVRTSEERAGGLRGRQAANHKGVEGTGEYINRYDEDEIAELTEARLYPADFFDVPDWSCPDTVG